MTEEFSAQSSSFSAQSLWPEALTAASLKIPAMCVKRLLQKGAMERAEDKVRVHLRIKGRVQGVFFRASTLEQANRLGIAGWVRNCPDGSVEVVAEGERKKIDDLVSWCRHGPPGAHVYDVRLQWEDFHGEFHDFRITR